MLEFNDVSDKEAFVENIYFVETQQYLPDACMIIAEVKVTEGDKMSNI